MANSSFNNWSNVLSPSRNELVFSGRNKHYGAFDLRKHHNRNIAIALFTSTLFIGLAVSIPAIINKFKDTPVQIEIPDTSPLVIPYVITPPQPPVEIIPEKPAEKASQVKTTENPPLVATDKKVENTAPVQAEPTAAIGVQNNNGTENSVTTTPGTGNSENADKVERYVQEMPEFIEGSLSSYINKNTHFPPLARDAGISGTVYVYFVVDTDGSVTDVKIERGVSGGQELEKEAMRVIKSLPLWKPGRNNGKLVKVSFIVPIKFSLK